MTYLLLVSHSTLAKGLEGAMEMLLGSRSFVLSCGMEDGTAPAEFRDEFTRIVDPISPEDKVVLLADIAGGSPLKNALVVLDNKGLGDNVIVFGGANLPMAISALMGIEDGLGLDDIRDAMLADGVAAVKQI